MALTQGIRKVKGKMEVVVNCACAAVGLIAFIEFYVECYKINMNGYNGERQNQANMPSQNHLSISDDFDDDITEYTTKVEADFASSQDEYDRLVQTMLEVWVALAGATLLAWCYVQWVRFYQIHTHTHTHTQREREGEREKVRVHTRTILIHPILVHYRVDVCFMCHVPRHFATGSPTFVQSARLSTRGLTVTISLSLKPRSVCVRHACLSCSGKDTMKSPSRWKGK